jgi:hypothetical protein
MQKQLKQTEERIEKLHMILDKEKAEKKQIQLENQRLNEEHNSFLLGTGNFVFKKIVILGFS